MFDEIMWKASDTDFLIRIVRQFDFEVIPTILIKNYEHTGPRARKNWGRGAEAYERIIQKHWETLLAHPELWVALHYKTGWQHYHAGHKARGRKYMWKAIQKNPLYLKCWMGLLLFESLGSRGVKLHQQFSGWKSSFGS